MRPKVRTGLAAACATIAAISTLIARPAPAGAQCTSNASSCVNCHEVQGLRPVQADAQPWHADHNFGDLCASCHHGDPSADAKGRAHAGMCAPLDAPAVTCGTCHQDGAARAERYQAVLRDRPAPVLASTPDSELPPPPPPAPPRGASIDRVLTGVALALGAALALVLGRRRLRGDVGAWLRAGSWSPYVAGAGLGVIVAITEVWMRRPVAAAGAFDRLAAYPGQALFPSSLYYRHVMQPQITWQVWLMIGLLLGAFASSHAAGQTRWRWLPDSQWQDRFGPSRTVRLVVAFVGAALVQLGAGIAGGCTSGLAISGGATLAPAAFLFMAGMFGGGIPTAWLVYRGRSS